MVSYASIMIHAKSWWLTDVPMFDDSPTFTISARQPWRPPWCPWQIWQPPSTSDTSSHIGGSKSWLWWPTGFFPYTIGGVPFKYWIMTIGGCPLINKPWFINPGLTLPKIVGLGNCLVKSKVHNPYISAIARWHATAQGNNEDCIGGPFSSPFGT